MKDTVKHITGFLAIPTVLSILKYLQIDDTSIKD